MEKLSRVRKYEELKREFEKVIEENIEVEEIKLEDSLENEVETETTIEESEILDNLLNSLNEENTIENEEIVTEEVKEVDTYHDEFLNNFLQEVSNYNKSQGLLNKEDAHNTILSSIRGEEIEVIEPVLEEVEEIEDEDDFNNTISLEIEKILSSINQPSPEVDEVIVPIISENNYEDLIPEETAQVIEEVEETEKTTVIETLNNKTVEVDSFDDDIDASLYVNALENSKDELLNDTTVIKVDNNVVEQEVEEKPNAILNVLIIVLFVVLIAILVLIGYWLLVAKGII